MATAARLQAGETVALWSRDWDTQPDAGHFVQMHANGTVSPGPEAVREADATATWVTPARTLERFTVVLAPGGRVALRNARHNKFLGLDATTWRVVGEDADGSRPGAAAAPPSTCQLSVVEAGLAGGERLVALHFSMPNRFMRREGAEVTARSGARNADALPRMWRHERFRLVRVRDTAMQAAQFAVPSGELFTPEDAAAICALVDRACADAGADDDSSSRAAAAVELQAAFGARNVFSAQLLHPVSGEPLLHHAVSRGPAGKELFKVLVTMLQTARLAKDTPVVVLGLPRALRGKVVRPPRVGEVDAGLYIVAAQYPNAVKLERLPKGVERRELAAPSMVLSPSGETPLHLAALHGHVDAASKILRWLGVYIDVDQANAAGSTAVHLACTANKPLMLQRLLEARANPNVFDNNGRTPLHNACNSLSEPCIRTLLADFRVAPDQAALDGRTPRAILLGKVQPTAASQGPTNATKALKAFDDGLVAHASDSGNQHARAAWAGDPFVEVVLARKAQFDPGDDDDDGSDEESGSGVAGGAGGGPAAAAAAAAQAARTAHAAAVAAAAARAAKPDVNKLHGSVAELVGNIAAKKKERGALCARSASVDEKRAVDKALKTLERQLTKAKQAVAAATAAPPTAAAVAPGAQATPPAAAAALPQAAPVKVKPSPLRRQQSAEAWSEYESKVARRFKHTWDRVRRGEFDCTNDLALDGSGVALLFKSLACSAALAAGADVCEAGDEIELLQQYHAYLVSGGNANNNGGGSGGGGGGGDGDGDAGASDHGEGGKALHVHGLYVLAVARSLSGNGPLQASLLRDFKTVYPTLCREATDARGGGWLTKAELRLLESGPTVVPRPAAPVDQAATRWADLRTELVGRGEEFRCAAMDKLMKLIGLRGVKQAALQLFEDLLANQRLRANGHGDAAFALTLNFAFLGNPGSGKTTVARIFADLLQQAGARQGNKIVEMKASEALVKGAKMFSSQLAGLTGGPRGLGPPQTAPYRVGLEVSVQCSDGEWYPGKVLKRSKDDPPTYEIRFADGTEDEGIDEDCLRSQVAVAQGGVLFIDEAHELDPRVQPEGRGIVADIMTAAEDFRSTVTIILSGYRKDIEEKLWSYNPGLAGRFSYHIDFEDFTESELGQLFNFNCDEHNIVCAEKVTNVARRRVARGIGTPSFANGRDVRAVFERAVKEAKASWTGNERPTLSIKHIIGERPSRANNRNLDAALTELHEKYAGLTSVKKAIGDLVSIAASNWDLESRGEPIKVPTLNRLFFGNPGTGKTSIAAIYGRVLKALRLLSNGQVVLTTAGDFKGAAVGETEANTKRILDNAQGKVLVIDEAYNLWGGGGGGGGGVDYGSLAIDVIVEKVQTGGDIAVIMLGYERQMVTMLDNANPGLRSRFDPGNALRFADYNDRELTQILVRAARSAKVRVPLRVRQSVVEHISKQRQMHNFGNARLVTTTLDMAIRSFRAREDVSAAGRNANEGLPVLTVRDFFPTTPDDPATLLEGLQTGNFVEAIKAMGASALQRRREGRPPPTALPNFIFAGSTGTGKTTIAEKMGKLLRHYGVLASDKLVVTSGGAMTADFQGQTKTRVRDLMDSARGGVLFIDEAYELGNGAYGVEAQSALLGMMTEDVYMKSTVVIIAGYQTDIDQMLARNEGMKARFQKRINFNNWPPHKCLALVRTKMSQQQPRPFCFGNDAADEQALEALLLAGFRRLAARPGWSNARDAVAMFVALTEARDTRLSKQPFNPDVPLMFAKEDVDDAVTNFLRARPPEAAPANSMRGGGGDGDDGADCCGGGAQAPATASVHAHRHVHRQRHKVKIAEAGGGAAADDSSDDDAPVMDEDADGGGEAGVVTRARGLMRQQIKHAEAAGANLNGEDARILQDALPQMQQELEQLEQAANEAARMRRRKEAMEKRIAELRRQERERQAREEEEQQRAEAAAAEQQRLLEEQMRIAAEEAERERIRQQMERERLEREREAERQRLIREEADRRAAEALRRLQEKQESARLAQVEADRKARELAAQRLREAERQRALQRIGRCRMNFRWINKGDHYRCAGGTHTISMAELNDRMRRA